MRKRDYLGTFELIVISSLIRVGDEAYGVSISQEIKKMCGREVALASIYVTLDRLERKGLVTSELGEPTAERGGRAKKYFRITAKGIREVQSTQRALSKLWKGIPQLAGETR
jgi:PadR family transcriptional regulator, regulatory protein PadR